MPSLVLDMWSRAKSGPVNSVSTSNGVVRQEKPVAVRLPAASEVDYDDARPALVVPLED